RPSLRRSGCSTSPASTGTGNTSTRACSEHEAQAVNRDVTSSGDIRTRGRMPRGRLPNTRSAELYSRARELLPGGVNSPVRAMRAIGRDPIFIADGAGAHITDVDGNDYIDWVCSWGPLILGHA